MPTAQSHEERPATLDMVAKQARVSPSTVSRILNGTATVSVAAGDTLNSAALSPTRMPRFASSIVIVITARSAVEDRLAGLDGGADDFVIKPFATAELMSRIGGMPG